jgi:virginiamycin B lyase
MNRWVTSAGAFVVLSLAFVAVPQGQERQEGRGPAPLPDGPGKEAVTATCGSCHGLNMITGATGYSQSAWRDLIATMVRLPADREAAITQYLATHFPPKPGRAPELVGGDVSVTFKEWMVPTLGQRSRDPLQTRDGTI